MNIFQWILQNFEERLFHVAPSVDMVYLVKLLSNH